MADGLMRLKYKAHVEKFTQLKSRKISKKNCVFLDICSLLFLAN